jgi:hypothetical protein
VAGAATTYPKRNNNSGLALVSQMRVSNAQGGWLSTDYQYKGNRADQRGRGDLGFEEVVKVDTVKSITTRVIASQDFPYIGMPTQLTSTQANGVVLGKTTNTLANVVTTGGAKYPYVSNSVVERKDLNGATFPTVTTTVAPPPAGIDVYGNIKSATETITDGSDVFTSVVTNTYKPPATSWLVGLLEKTVVAKTSSLSTGTTPAGPVLTLTGCTSTTPTSSPTQARMTCTLGNSGTASAIAVFWASPIGTSVAGPSTCAASTANCGTVTVSTATSAGSYNGTLVATPYPSGTAASVAVSLTVNGTAAPTVISISPTSLAFGTVAKGALSPIKSLTVTNTGSAAAVITWTKTDISGSSLNGTYSTTACATLAAGATCTVNVRYAASCSGGSRNVNLSAQGANFTTVTVPLTASTSSLGACLQATPLPLTE